ncbi:HD-GYP domain-containing protein [Hydrogenophaga sp. OTU3427]|uniref:HD-GYP domain-containing protein n=1 Tax=Hydrogenophaga sp. OTU3427 TaxID=3043856 RepID=UPI00313E297F
MSFYVPLPLEGLQLNKPIPVNIWEPNGTLLLRKGEVIEGERHLQNLMAHSPVITETDYRAWSYSYTTQLDQMVRRNHTLDEIAQAGLPSEVSRGTERELLEPVSDWPDLHASLTTLLHQGAQAQDFVSRLTALEAKAQRLVAFRPDQALFMLVSLLQDRNLSYCAAHALLSATMCELVAPVAGLSEADRASLFRAAITMNLGMARLQDELARQSGPLTDEQRREVQNHPQRTVEVLKGLGVGDPLWLKLVAEHHGAPEGAASHPALQLLCLADVFVARISPRKSRPALLSQQAARGIYLNEKGEANATGAVFVRTLGIYLPGSFVRLANDEVAVVVKRGRRANTPTVFSIIGRQGMPLGEPALRDTTERAYEVKASVAAEEVKVVLNPARLLSRL